MFAIETYAYLKGQSSALKAIAKQFPALKDKAEKAQSNSAFSFARAQGNIEDFLQEELTGSEFDLLQQKMDSIIGEQLRNPIEKERYAVEFLEKVSRGPRFISDTLLLKGILSLYTTIPRIRKSGMDTAVLLQLMTTQRQTGQF